MKYKCNECRAEFDTLFEYDALVSVDPCDMYETFYLCPACHGKDYDKVYGMMPEEEKIEIEKLIKGE